MLLRDTLFIILAALVAVVMLFLSTRTVPESWRDREHSVLDGFDSFNRMLFAFTLSFAIVMGWQALDSAHQACASESDALSSVYWSADSLPEPARTEVQSMVRNYFVSVVEQEWPLMVRGQASSHSESTLDDLRKMLYTVRTSAEPAPLRTDALDQVQTVAQARAQRLALATSQVPRFIEVELIVSGFLILALPIMREKDFTARTVAPAAVLAAFTVAVIASVFELNHPFGGAIRVGPDMFLAELANLNGAQA
ncbi:hypothetical protein [Streptomyces wuyuanensis]|uniref:bestrophin-like domain n=1 Tax=Streptomyces wuyuanensis TaxID=1196353 RepID=UPI00343A9ECD